MDLGSALILDLKGERQYYVQIATKEFCSPKFWQAFKSQTPLSAQELIQEDHYQLLSTLNAVCKGRQDLTKETKIMLEILETTNTIEDAIYFISRNLELMHKLFSEIRQSKNEDGNFSFIFLRNLGREELDHNYLKRFEYLLLCKPNDLAK